MKWLVLACLLVCLARFNEGGVLQYVHDKQNVSKKSETKEEKKGSHVQVSQEEESRDIDDAECLPGTEWESHCHYCRCSESGIAECLKQITCDSDTVIDPIRCKPNTTFTRDCNTCVCLESGLGLCTVNYCRRSSLPKKSDLLSGRECAPGSRWKSQCNDCGCSSEGYAFCTEKGCLGQESEPVLRCAPDSMWKNQCNTCWCTSDGRALCTKIGCMSDREYADINLEEEPIDFEDRQSQLGAKSTVNDTKRIVCQANRMFIKDCNTCWCNEEGTSYFCTRKICVSDLPDEISTDEENTKAVRSSTNDTKNIVCQANRMFIKDCNTCWCNKEGTSYFCTRKVCVSDLPDEVGVDEEKPESAQVINRDCRPDEVFELDCNTCRCDTDGKSFSCTRRTCVEIKAENKKNASMHRSVRSIPSQTPPKNCQPREEFRLDCNHCLCDSDGKEFSCTRFDCSKISNGGVRRKRGLAKEVETKCVPESVFDQECNVCHCTKDGNHATCTLKRCGQDKHEDKSENDVVTSSTEPSFRCNPGEQFKRVCNDCTCSADGRSVFCTLRLCDEDMTPSE